jgi:hypothetical protein
MLIEFELCRITSPFSFLTDPGTHAGGAVKGATSVRFSVHPCTGLSASARVAHVHRKTSLFGNQNNQYEQVPHWEKTNSLVKTRLTHRENKTAHHHYP